MERESEDQLKNFICDSEKLIDITKEDDDLLAHSPLLNSLEDLRLSVSFDDTIEHEGFKFSEFRPSEEFENAVENFLQKEQKLLCSHEFVPARPSYLRKSLAWDSAFFTSAGVLDRDELTFINKGFRTAEMQLTPHTPSRKISIQNKTKTSAPQGRNITSQRSANNKTQRISKREESHSLPLKAPKAFSRMKNVLMGQSKSASVDCHSIGSGNNRKLGKRFALENSPCSPSSASLSYSEYSSVIANSINNSSVSCSPYDRKASAPSTKVASALLKRKTEPRKSRLSDKISISDAGLRDTVKGRSPILYMQNEETDSPDQISTQISIDTSLFPTGSRKKLKPSCLRLPSPKIGFFDEAKSTTPTLGRSLQSHFEMQRTPPRKPGYSDRKLKSPLPKVWSSMKSVSDVGMRFRAGKCGEIEEKLCSKSRKVDAGESDQKRASQRSFLRRDDEGRRVKASRSSREAKGQRSGHISLPELSNSIKKEKNGCKQRNLHNKARTPANLKDQVNDLSRYFEVIDLSRDMVTKNKEDNKDCPLSQAEDNTISKFNDESNQSSTPRTPLADKMSVGNRNGSLMQSTTIEKLDEKPSKFPRPEGLPDKENSTLTQMNNFP